jgi:hypothetical protein
LIPSCYPRRCGSSRTHRTLTGSPLLEASASVRFRAFHEQYGAALPCRLGPDSGTG